MNDDRWFTIEPNERVKLGASITQGGEGEIFASRPGRIVKLFFHPTDELSAKVRWMAANPLPPAPSGYAADHAWPNRIITRNGRFEGFEMKHLEGMLLLTHILDEETRQREAPQWTYRHSVRLTVNVAQASARLHRHQVVIADVSPCNLLVDGRDAYCALIDLDSAKILASTQTFPCRVSTVETAAPEVLRGEVAYEDRTESQDAFGIAVLIYRLLLLHHPYSGVMTTGGRTNGVKPLNTEQRISRNVWAFSDLGKSPSGTVEVRVPPYGLSAVECLSAELLGLFHAAFNLGFVDPSLRPSPRRFVPILEQFYRSLRPCRHNRKHYFHSSMTNCPLCQVRKDCGFDPFPAS